MCNPEVIGIIGTLLGTVLGWILSEFSKRGKLNIYPQWKDSFQHQDGYGGFKTSKNREEAEYYSYKLSLELYNSAGEPKIMRGISVAYFHDKTKILTSVPQDDRTGRSSGSMMIFDDVGSVTIPAKTIASLQLHGGFNNSEDAFTDIWRTNRVVLVYRDEKSREKYIKINCRKYAEYFSEG